MGRASAPSLFLPFGSSLRHFADANMSRKSGSRSSSKRAKKSGSNVFDMFTQKQVAEFKDGFQIMDRDRDGVINKTDLRAIFDEIGRIATEQELDDMLAEAEGPLNFTMFLNMFAQKQTGESDDDDVVATAFRAFSDETGYIEADRFRHALMVWGDKFTSKEVDEVFDEFECDDAGNIDCEALVSMLCAGSQAEEEAPAE